MRFQVLALSALACLASAHPSDSHVIQARAVTDACATQPTGSGPTPYKTDALSFQKFGTFSTMSTTATAPTGYQRTFHNHLQSCEGDKYMGMYYLTSYDATSCASLCTSSVGCIGFNVFYERNPTLNPAPLCLNPPPTTNIVCTLWGQAPTVVNATNAGQMRAGFTVVIAGSSGYAKLGSVSASLPDDGVNPYS